MPIKFETTNGAVVLEAEDGAGEVAVTVPRSGFVSAASTTTLTNKTISADDNTINGLPPSSFLLANVQGRLDGSAPTKAIPDGIVVGTTDTQVLTAKTLAEGTDFQSDALARLHAIALSL